MLEQKKYYTTADTIADIDPWCITVIWEDALCSIHYR